jgi:D-sedoheptulose 7-phosphate isomerase
MPDTVARPRSLASPATAAQFARYSGRLIGVLERFDWAPVAALADELADCAATGRQLFIAGNGGSAGNAVHLANDFLYAWSKQPGLGLRVNALPANTAVLTCLANDEGYGEVFAAQLAVLGNAGDVLLVFSGSGNSPNILRALEQARRMGIKSYAVLGYDGGKAKSMCDVPIHVRIDDMQIAEDLQLILGHMIMQHLCAQRDALGAARDVLAPA